MKKILFITYYWPPSGGAGVQRSLKFVKYLPEFGVEPIVLTVDENYASYPLSDNTLSKEVGAKIKVVRTKSFEALKVLSFFTSKKNIPHGGFANSNKDKPFQKFLRYIRGNLFIPDARIGWINHAVKAAEKIIVEEKIDTIFITSPPHSSQLIGLRLKSKLNIKWIADLRDPWTDIYYYKDLLHTKRSAEKDLKLESEVLKKADDVISVSTHINEMFKSKIFSEKNISNSPGRFHIIPNGFDEKDFVNRSEGAKELFYISYVGSIADSYNPEIFFKVLSKVVDEFKDVSFRIRIVGSMPIKVSEILRTNNLENITEYISHVTHDKAIKYMQESAVLLLLIPDVENNNGILTGKIFEYMASRRPVIGLGPADGDAAAILKECNAGKMFERNNDEGLYSYLKSLILQWQENKELVNMDKTYYKYSRKELAGKLASIILKKDF